MAKVNLLVCDSCDCRDNLLHPATNAILAIQVVVTCLESKIAPENFSADLCEMCRKNLHKQIVRSITQKARQAPDAQT